MHETFAEDPTCIKNCSINGAVPQCLTSLLKDYEDRGGICKDSLMDSEVTYKPFNIRPARPDETLDYTGIWKVSSEACSVSGHVTIGHDPQEIAPKITTGHCSDETEVSFRYSSSKPSHSFGVLGDLVKFSGKFGAVARS